MAKKKSNKSKHSMIKIFVCLCFLTYVAYTVVAQQITINSKKAELKVINEQIAAEEIEKAKLEEKKKTVNTPEYIEYVARTEYGYAAPDEIVVVDSTARN